MEGAVAPDGFGQRTSANMEGVPNPRTAAPSQHRLPFIDFLRAVAVLLVFTRHATEVFSPLGHGMRLLYLVSEKLNFGGFGVVIFFAISGFVIPSTLRGDRVTGAIRYIIGRVFRLYPAFILSIVPSACAHYWIAGKVFTWHDTLLNLTMIPRLFGGEMANGAYWTLEVEIAFYLICLFLYVGGLLREPFSLAAITFLTFLVFQSSQQVFFGGAFNAAFSGPTYFYNLDIAVMCWGAMLRVWWNGGRLNAATAAIFCGFAGFWIVWRPAVLIAGALHHDISGINTNIVSQYSGGLALFLAAVMLGGFRFPFMLWLGRISYSFYLLHGVVIHLIQYALATHPSLQGHWNGLYLLLSFLLTVAVSQLSYALVEQPGIRLGHRITGTVLTRLAANSASLTAWSSWLEKGIEMLRPRHDAAESHESPDPASSRLLAAWRLAVLFTRAQLARSGRALKAGSVHGDIRQLTGLRGFAALNVALMHYGLGETSGFQPFIFGNAAVDVFFCLSGFTLCLVYGAGRTDRLAFGRYAVARIARVYPLYIVTTLFTLWYSMAWRANGFPTTFNHDLTVQLIRQATLLSEIPLPFLGPMGNWNAPAWSISVEAFCYVAIFPALFAISARARRLNTGTIVLLIMILVATSFVAYVKLFTPKINGPCFPQPHGGLVVWVPLIRAVTMFSAGWLAHLLYLAHQEATIFFGAITDTLALVFLGVVASEHFGLLRSASVVMIAPFLVLGLMSGRSLTARILASRPMHFLGVISYSLYLWHLPLRTVAMYFWPWRSDQHLFHAVVFPLSLTLVVSTLSYAMIEMPARDAIKRLTSFRRPLAALANNALSSPSAES
jgi:peptidoglycan/LPS O-acetylase OafA/YrhL